MRKDIIDYGRLVDEAMHVIVFKVLKRVEQEGLPGDHHFFISFITKHKGVKINEELIKKYPHEMTIVLQFQYQDLKVDAKGFSITLSFNGRKESIYIPYAAISGFADPSVQFGLQFREVEYDFEDVDLEVEGGVITSMNGPSQTDQPAEKRVEMDNVISFDQLRKQNNH